MKPIYSTSFGFFSSITQCVVALGWLREILTSNGRKPAAFFYRTPCNSKLVLLLLGFCMGLVVPQGLQAQVKLGANLQKTIESNAPSLLARLESRNGFLVNLPIQTRMIKVGANFGPKLGLGLGLNFLNKSSVERLSSKSVRLVYASVFVEYKFFEKGRYSAGIPIQFGFGSLEFVDAQPVQTTVFIYEAMLNGDVKLFRYLGVGLGLGYRLGLQNQFADQIPLTTPAYAWRINVFLAEVYKDLTKGKKLSP